MKLKDAWKKSYDQPRQHIKKQRHYFANKGLSSQTYDFSSSQVWMWELDYKESWALKKWCFWTVVLEKSVQSLLDYQEIKAVNPKGNQSWILIGSTDAEAETPILWPPDAKNWLLGRDPDAGKDWRQEETGMTEDEMVGWHHRFDGHEFVQALRSGDGQGSLAFFSPWCCKESEMTEQLNWTELSSTIFRILNTSVRIPSPLLALLVVILPKAHLTSHSRMSDSRWVATRSWLSHH